MNNTLHTDKLYAQHLASEYAPKDTSRLTALRKLDSRAKLPAVVTAYSLGIVSARGLGLGMCLSMGILGGGRAFAGGIVLGVLGLAGMGVNYPLYCRLLSRGKQRYAQDILTLAREITER